MRSDSRLSTKITSLQLRGPDFQGDAIRAFILRGIIAGNRRRERSERTPSDNGQEHHLQIVFNLHMVIFGARVVDVQSSDTRGDKLKVTGVVAIYSAIFTER